MNEKIEAFKLLEMHWNCQSCHHHVNLVSFRIFYDPIRRIFLSLGGGACAPRAPPPAYGPGVIPLFALDLFRSVCITVLIVIDLTCVTLRDADCEYFCLWSNFQNMKRKSMGNRCQWLYTSPTVFLMGNWQQWNSFWKQNLLISKKQKKSNIGLWPRNNEPLKS